MPVKKGQGEALLQPNKDGRLQPVAYASNSLNATEQRYSQIEKECLAIYNAFAKCDHWQYGKLDIYQPLETINKKPLHKAPARLQNMLMRQHQIQGRHITLPRRHPLESSTAHPGKCKSHSIRGVQN